MAQTPANRLVPLKEHDPTALVSSRKIVSGVIKLHSGNDVSYSSHVCQP